MLTNGSHIIKEIFNTGNAAWPHVANKIFLFQYENNKVYRQYCDILKITPADVNRPEDIPFLPIQFFKSHNIACGDFKPELIFESSGTTGSVNSKHFVKDRAVYEESFLKGFKKFYGSVEEYCVIGLLPSYLERGSSSLVYMVNDLIKRSGHADSGFYLYEHEKLQQTILKNETAGKKTILIGVTYALLDFAEKFPMPLKHTIIMETGGMKGRREELTRAEVHHILQSKFQIENIHSEYGMTELLSQGYSSGNGIFNCCDTMKVLLRAEDDPFDISATVTDDKKFITGAVNIIDLANIYSCSFIATDDAGKLYPDGSFEIIGRLDNSDIRGCGLMIL
ncbi:MAG: acyl transferase [Sphingobacteriales bacterium]|nr:MAG: acyl transferase [Sphingobacteriales bacterium]